jgi:nucleotide-binding universal stress UspA family protein
LEERRAGAEKELQRLAKTYGLKGTCRAEIGSAPFDVICWVARQIQADMIVTPTHGNTGFKRVFLGSTAERLVQHSPCPVLVARQTGKRRSSIDRILVPVDFSRCSLAGLNYAIEIAHLVAAKILVFHAIDMSIACTADGFAMYDLGALEKQAREAAEAEMAKFVREANFGDVKFETAIEVGLPIQHICDRGAKEKIDLIITSTHGRTGLKHILIGSTAENVVRRAGCPVLVVPSHPEVRARSSTRSARGIQQAAPPIRSRDGLTKKERRASAHPFPERRGINRFREGHGASARSRRTQQRSGAR